MKIKVSTGKIPYTNFAYNGNFLLFLYTFGSLFTYFTAGRFVVEGVFLALCLVIIGLYSSLFIFIVSLAYAIFMGVTDGIAALSLSYYVLLALVVSGNIKFKQPSPTVVYICFCVGVYFLIQETLQLRLRPTGIFNSPLSASYFIACCILLLVKLRRSIGTVLIFPSIILPGSRAGFLITSLMLKQFSTRWKLAIVAFAPILISIGIYFNVRALSFHATSDSRRLNSWMKIFDQDYSSYLTLLGGQGRASLGSLGQALGTSQTVSLESSFLGLIYSYGILGIIAVMALTLIFALRKSMYWWIFFIICSVSVVMDSLAISMLLIMAISLLIDRNGAKNLTS
jgi:hypothetical protein